jgi:hypothetical protein
MRTVTVSARAKTLNTLLKKARRRNVILESTSGERFVLAPISEWEGFEVGSSEDFGVEVKRTASNKKLARFMAERRARDKGRSRLSIEEVRKELGL